MSNETSIVKPQEAVVKYYKPSELLGMFTSYLSQQDMNKQLIFLQGIYLNATNRMLKSFGSQAKLFRK